MKCISSPSYSVIINGYRGSEFKPTRRLRQGDPFNPFLFLICSEELSTLMRMAMKGVLKRAKACRNGPLISHLLFANNSNLFGEATTTRALLLDEILKEYEKCLGQRVNFSKFMIFFSSNTSGWKR